MYNLISILQRVLTIDTLSISSETALGYIQQNAIGVKSTLIQVTAWRYQASIHYLNQCWSRSTTPCVFTRPQRSLLDTHILKPMILWKFRKYFPYDIHPSGIVWYHDCPVSLRRQVISSRSIDFMWFGDPCFPRGRMLMGNPNIFMYFLIYIHPLVNTLWSRGTIWRP